MMAIKKASMCARVTSTYMEFTFTFGPKPEFKFSFNLMKIFLRIIYFDLIMIPVTVPQIQ